MNTPKSSTSEMQEMRYRISQLEHLMVTNSLTNVTNSSSSTSPTLTQNSLIERISHLEGLLAASEMENKNLCNEIQLLFAAKNRDEVELLERINFCNNEISDLKCAIQLVELKCSKGNKKIENMKSYIDSLPSKEELDEAKETIIHLESENHTLTTEMDTLRHEIRRLQIRMLEKDNDYQNAVVRLKELEPLEEAQQEYLNKNWNDRVFDFSDEKSISEIFTVQRAQIIRCGKIISALREKVGTAETKRAECEVNMANNNTEMKLLNQQVVSSKLKTDKLVQTIKQQEQERKGLQSECDKLRSELERKVNFLNSREQEMEYLIKLATEVDVCMNDLRKLVNLGESIAHGEEPSVDNLIGIPDQLQLHLMPDASIDVNNSFSEPFLCSTVNNLKCSESSSFNKHSGIGDGDPEWILERLKSVTDMRKSIEKLRNQLIDLYTDMLEESTDACNVQ